MVDGTEDIDKQVIPLDIVKDVVMEIKEEYKEQELILEEPQEEVKVEEINIQIPDSEMSNPQEDFSLPLFTRSLILELSSTIISHSEERKDLMASLEQKRKKWIMWGKDTEEKKK